MIPHDRLQLTCHPFPALTLDTVRGDTTLEQSNTMTHTYTQYYYIHDASYNLQPTRATGRLKMRSGIREKITRLVAACETCEGRPWDAKVQEKICIVDGGSDNRWRCVRVSWRRQ